MSYNLRSRSRSHLSAAVDSNIKKLPLTTPAAGAILEHFSGPNHHDDDCFSGPTPPSHAEEKPNRFRAGGGSSSRRPETSWGKMWYDYVKREEERSRGKIVETPRVYVKVKIQNIGKIEPIQGTDKASCEIDFSMMLDWEDPSTVEINDPVIESYHFSPHLEIFNCGEEGLPSLRDGTLPHSSPRIQETERNGDGVLIQPRPGHVKRTYRHQTKVIISRFDTANYPFDSHAVQIKLRGTGGVKITSASYLDDENASPRSLFEKDAPRRKCFHSYYFSERGGNNSQNWKIIKFEKDEITRHKGDDVLIVTVLIQRNPVRVVVQVFGLFICIALSVSSFFLNTHNALGERLACTSANLLALGAFYQNNSIANQSYLTLLDWYIIYLMLLCFGQGWAHVLINIVPDTRAALVEALGCPSNRTDPFEDPALSAGEQRPPDFNAVSMVWFSSLGFCVALTFILENVRNIRANKLTEFSEWVFGPVQNLVRKAARKFLIVFVAVFLLFWLSLGWDFTRYVRALQNALTAFLLSLSDITQLSGRSRIIRPNRHLCDDDVLSFIELLTSNAFLFHLSIFSIVYAHFALFASVILLYFDPNLFFPKKRSRG